MEFSKELTFIRVSDFTSKSGKACRKLIFQDTDDKFIDFLVDVNQKYNLKEYTKYLVYMELKKDDKFVLHLNYKGVK